MVSDLDKKIRILTEFVFKGEEKAIKVSKDIRNSAIDLNQQSKKISAQSLSVQRKQITLQKIGLTNQRRGMKISKLSRQLSVANFNEDEARASAIRRTLTPLTKLQNTEKLRLNTLKRSQANRRTGLNTENTSFNLAQSQQIARLKDVNNTAALLKNQKLNLKSMQNQVSEGRRFKLEYLGIMFAGMALQKFTVGFLRDSINIYNQQNEKMNEFLKITNKLTAAWTFFRFRLIDVLTTSPLFKTLVDLIAGLVDRLSGMSDRKIILITSAFVAAAAAASFLFVGGQLLLGLDSLKKFFVGSTILKFFTAAHPVARAITIFLLIMAAAIASFEGSRNSLKDIFDNVKTPIENAIGSIERLIGVNIDLGAIWMGIAATGIWVLNVIGVTVTLISSAIILVLGLLSNSMKVIKIETAALLSDFASDLLFVIDLFNKIPGVSIGTKGIQEFIDGMDEISKTTLDELNADILSIGEAIDENNKAISDFELDPGVIFRRIKKETEDSLKSDVELVDFFRKEIQEKLETPFIVPPIKLIDEVQLEEDTQLMSKAVEDVNENLIIAGSGWDDYLRKLEDAGIAYDKIIGLTDDQTKANEKLDEGLVVKSLVPSTQALFDVVSALIEPMMELIALTIGLTSRTMAAATAHDINAGAIRNEASAVRELNEAMRESSDSNDGDEDDEEEEQGS